MEHEEWVEMGCAKAGKGIWNQGTAWVKGGREEGVGSGQCRVVQ